jgi:hypothetical protein
VNSDDDRDYDDEMPDPALVWRWVGKATRPVVGWVLLALGGLFILLGWIGVSGESNVAKQIPYVVSGGIAGVLLAIIGAYFLGTEELRKDSGRLDRLERMVDELHTLLLERTDGVAEAVDADRVTSYTNGTNGSGHETPASFVALTGTTTYHRPGCQMIEGKSGAAVMAPSTVRKRGLEPCPLCEPAPVAS